jgi:tRNA(His) 5'-end guanylyltransferase
MWYSDDYNSQVFFDGRIQKMNSVLASMCSVKFNQLLQLFARRLDTLCIDLSKEAQYKVALWEVKAAKMPLFDSRVWPVPTLMEVVNTFLWREWDATKNAISQAASAYYSHKELDGKNGSEKQEMLFQKGANFNDYPDWFKRGTYIQRRKILKKFTTDEIDKLPLKHEARSNPDLMVERTEVREISMPILSKVINRVDVFFKGEEPLVEMEQMNKNN